MASKAVEDAVEAYLRANWSESVVLTENLEQEAPQDGAPFLTLEFPVSESAWPGLNGLQWREEGAFRIALAVPRGEGMGRMRAWGETLANLFRGVDVGGEACCGVPDEPYTDDQASEGLYFVGTMVVPYYRLSPAASPAAAPGWVPAGYDIWIEPRVLDGSPLGRAWVADVGDVAVDTLLGADPNTEASGYPSQFVPEYMSTDGYTIQGPTFRNLAFIGAARSLVLVGATIRLTLVNCAVGGTATVLLLSADGNEGLEVGLYAGSDAESGHISGLSWNGPFNVRLEPYPSCESPAQALACTLTPTRAEFSANGLTPANAAVLDAADWPTSGANPLVASVLSGGTLAVATIGIKRPVAAVDLPALAIYDSLPAPLPG